MVTLLQINSTDSSIVCDMILREGEGNKRNSFFSKTVRFILAPRELLAFHLTKKREKERNPRASLRKQPLGAAKIHFSELPSVMCRGKMDLLKCKNIQYMLC